MAEWWSFDRYGKKGAMSRVDATIDALHLVAIKPSRPAPPPAPADAPAEEEKPTLVLPSPNEPRTPKRPVSDANTDVNTLLARSRTAQRRIGDGDDEDGDTGETEAERRARENEESVFDDRPVVQLNHVTRMPGQLQMQQEEQVYGRTNVHLLVEAVEPDGYARDPVDEGFFAPDRPDVSLWNLDKLVARLTREDRKRQIFFEGADNHMKLESYPVHDHVMRAANTELYAAEPLLATRILAPAPYTGKDHWYDFRIALNWVQLVEHALFTREDKLCRELEDACAEYKRRETIGLVSHYDSKLRGLRSLLQSQVKEADTWTRGQLATMEQPDPSALDRVVLLSLQRKQLDTLLQLREAVDMRDREEHEQRVLFKQIYAKWMDIRTTRSEVTREMKDKGFWQNDLQPVPQTGRPAGESAQVSPVAAVTLPVPSPAGAPALRVQQPLSSQQLRPHQQNLPQPLPSPPSQSVPGYPGYPSASPPAPLASPSAASPYPAASPSAGQPSSHSQYPHPPPPLDVRSPMATSQFASPSGALSPNAAGSPMLDTLASPSAAQQAAAAHAAERAQQGDSSQVAAFSLPPPPPPPPPEMPAPTPDAMALDSPKSAYNSSPTPSPTAQASAMPPNQTAYDQASQQQYMAQQQQYQAMMQQQYYQQMQQQQQQQQPSQASSSSQQPAYDPAMQQQQLAAYQQQQLAYQQQQQLAYQQYLAQQQAAATGQRIMGSKPEEETKEATVPASAAVQPLQPQSALPPPAKKGRHVTMQETMAQEQARRDRERMLADQAALDAATAANRPVLSVQTGATLTSDELLSVRARSDFGLERRAGLLKETYVGYPSNFKVGRHQLDWKNKPEDTVVYRAEKAAWLDQIKAEMREVKLRRRLERCIAQGGVDLEPEGVGLTPEQLRAQDQALFDSIEARMSSMRRRPGGTKYLPVYNEDAKVFDTSRCLQEEQARRRRIDEYKIYIRVFVNGMRVCDTEPQAISFPRFKAHFDQVIPLRLVAMPSSITLQIYHARGLLAADEQLAELGLPVPEFGAPASVQQYSFAGAHIDPETCVMKHVPSAKEPFGPNRYTSGILEASVAWGEGLTNAPEPMSAILAQFQKNDRPRLAMRNKMADYIQAAGAKSLDPNDPRNADMLEHMQRAAAARAGKGTRTAFVATESQVEGRLVNPRYQQVSARSLVLAARNESGFIRDAVPLRDEEISAQLYSYIRVRDDKDEEMDRFKAQARELDTQAMYEREQMRAQAKILNISHDVHDVAEVVNETDLPVLSVDMTWINKLFEKRRDLRPKREMHKALSAPKSCHIVVQVVKGQNLPVRRTDRMGASSAGKVREQALAGNAAAMPLEQQENVRTFVEVSLQDSCKRTAASRGTNPRWDQLVSLPFRPPAQSFSPASLSACTDAISFNVFDEITITAEVDPRLTRTRLHHSEQRWLGSFSIPFSTIYNAGAVDGAFAINVPPHLLGYEQPHAERDAFLYIYCTMDPVLATPPPRPDRFHHMNPFYARAIQWVSDLKARSPALAKRAYMAVAGDISSQPQFICRYITSERPPEKYQQPNVFTRFVATIPFTEDAQASLGTVKDIWCTSKEFLALQGGDWEEHAILLNNYFTWYDSNLADSGSRHHNYVALGSGFPEGDTAYVLRLGVSNGAIQSRLLVNAVTGRVYNLANALDRAACPLQSIALVFNADNIWANIQAEDDPTSCSYELFNPADWSAFFTTTFTRETAVQQYAMKFDTIQKSVPYTEEAFEWYVDRAAKIERMVERRFEKWRALSTHWDYGVCKVLRDFLLTFESHAQHAEDTPSLSMERPLTALKNAYGRIYGFPLHFNDSGDKRLLDAADDNPIIAAVKNTKIHENEDAKTVFALAVYIHPYPNRMGSVWLYVASLAEK